MNFIGRLKKKGILKKTLKLFSVFWIFSFLLNIAAQAIHIYHVATWEDNFDKIFITYLAKAFSLHGFIWLVFGSLLAIYLTMVLSQPIQSLITRLPPDIAARKFDDEYEIIANAIDLFIEQNNRNEQIISHQERLLRDYFLTTLFMDGSMPTLTNGEIGNYGIDEMLKLYYIIVIDLAESISSSDENGLLHEYDCCEEQINLLMEELYQIETPDELMALLPCKKRLLGVFRPGDESVSEQEVCGRMNEVARYLSSVTGVEVGVYCSNIHSGVSEAFYSYHEAIYLPACKGDGGMREWDTRREGVMCGTKKMLRLELKVVNLILAEEYERAYFCFEETVNFICLEQNHIDRLREKWIAGLSAKSYCALIEANPQNKDRIDHMEFMRYSSDLKTKGMLLRYWRDLFLSLKAPSAEVSSYTPQFKKVLEYVESHYKNCLLSLALVSQEFGLSTSYISRGFQKSLGMGFLDYVHRLRIEAAKKEILYSGKSIKDIAPMVGYTSILTMNRAFKKYEGTTPGSLRLKGMRNES